MFKIIFHVEVFINLPVAAQSHTALRCRVSAFVKYHLLIELLDKNHYI